MVGEDDQDGANDAARAFDALRAEVTVLRRAIETLPGAWEDNRPPDYSPDLGRIVKGLTAVEKRLAGVEAQPALKLPPELYSAAIQRAGHDVVRDTVSELQLTRQKLDGMIGSARSQAEQRDKVFWTGVTAFIVALLLGLIVSPYLASALPFGWSDSVAATVMDADEWNAGAALMQAAHPNRWNGLVAPFNLINGDAANAKAVAACQAAVAKTGKPRMCRIIVKVP